jgi:hypothetical protein
MLLQKSFHNCYICYCINFNVLLSYTVDPKFCFVFRCCGLVFCMKCFEKIRIFLFLFVFASIRFKKVKKADEDYFNC